MACFITLLCHSPALSLGLRDTSAVFRPLRCDFPLGDNLSPTVAPETDRLLVTRRGVSCLVMVVCDMSDDGFLSLFVLLRCCS